jgi:hypothetical protein
MVETPVPPVIALEVGVWPRMAAMVYEINPNVNNRAETAWRLLWPAPTAIHIRIQNLLV